MKLNKTMAIWYLRFFWPKEQVVCAPSSESPFIDYIEYCLIGISYDIYLLFTEAHWKVYSSLGVYFKHNNILFMWKYIDPNQTSVQSYC